MKSAITDKKDIWMILKSWNAKWRILNEEIIQWRFLTLFSAMEMLLDQMYNYALDEKESPHRFRWSWNILFFSFLVLILSSSLIWELYVKMYINQNIFLIF